MKIAIKTYGCTANTADTETITGILTTNGHQITTEHDADIIIFNTCAVKGPTENRIINAIKQTPKTKKTIIIGCLPKINLERLNRETQVNAIAGPSIGEQITKIITQITNNKKSINLQPTKKPPITLPKINTNPIISILPINLGCLGSCTYCAVVIARGKLQSYTIPEITQRLKNDLTTTNTKEFWITSQDTAAYGRDIGTNLAELLHTIGKTEGHFKTRIGMMTPNMIQDIQPELINAYKNPKIFKFLHLPIQSGDDQILKKMHRQYTTNEYKKLLTTFKTTFPNLTIATDIIVGFPGETKQAFENTLQILKEIKPDITNVSKFFARPKTLAANMTENKIPPEEIKHRSSTAAKLAKQLSFEKNLEWKNWKGKILIDEKGKINDTWIGRNFAYKPIVIKSKQNLLGKTLNVQITKITETYLIAENKHHQP
ncbi:MAG: tRNA (N(6)-L-threonylcarbamoyladenosine(37)-C(2))-methylthiotransferase [Candidatus Bathyarchaeota archaeon]|nr:tRNA (N(6)-L-threonylcarbamoyladenosine(37)-C(2))-methylthiotransferase [Candidatus Termiticorpusculum sp.]